MSQPKLNAPFVPPSQEDICDQMLADIRLEAQRLGIADVAVQPGTDNHRWAMAHAGVAMLQYSSIELKRPAITPLNAVGQDLDDWRESLGLPEVEPSPSTGKIVLTVSGSSTVSDGEPLVLPNGFRAVVVGNWIGVIDRDEIDIVTVDVGEATELPGGTEIRFVNPPSNINEKCTISKSVPLSGGTDEESEERKRTRVINAVANKPGGGNWAQLREIALEALGNVQDCFVYPALGGPSSVKVVPVQDLDPDDGIFTRAINSAGLSIIRDAIYAKTCDAVELVVQAAQDQPCDVALKVRIPNSSLSGGNGQGWVDQSPWPPMNTVLTAGRIPPVQVIAVSDSRTIIVDSHESHGPVVGQTRIAWWSPVDRKFRTFLVTDKSGSSGAWTLELDRRLVADDGTEVAAGDYISPAAVNSDAYGKSWVNAMRRLGPGENTEDPSRLPRSLRHPYIVDESPSSLSFATLELFQDAHSEITDLGYGYRSASSPSLPASSGDPPNILVPRNFGIYVLT